MPDHIPPLRDPVPIFAAHGLTLVPVGNKITWRVRERPGMHFVMWNVQRWEFCIKRGERWKIRKHGKQAQTIAKHIAAVLKCETENAA